MTGAGRAVSTGSTTEDPTTEGTIAEAANAWYLAHGRDFLWRRPGMTPWALYLIEVMAQQTQIERAARVALEWIERWPTPSALAAEPPAEILKAWGRLGYPRRALAVHAAAAMMAAEHDDAPPRDLEALLALPGVGPYTAAAVASFAYGLRVPVVDTNIRRVLARALLGVESTTPNARRDAATMETILPQDPETAKITNVAVMELGALVCTPRNPSCDICPLRHACAWRAAGYPVTAAPKRRQPRFHGSDRQVRGRIMAILRETEAMVPREALAEVSEDASQVDRAIAGLLRDRLIVRDGDAYGLPHR